MVIILTITIALVSGYLFALWRANDFGLPTLDLFKHKRANRPLTIVAVFPHPDDETMPTGGTLAYYAAQPDTNVMVITTTHGDAGETGGVCEQSELAAVRAQELKSATDALGVNQLILWDFPDGYMAEHVEKLKAQLAQTLLVIDPDVVITYDASGMYGHPDHIILHQVTKEITQQMPQTKLLYTTLPKKVLQQLDLPKTITLGTEVVDMHSKDLRQTLPKYKCTFWRYRMQKQLAIKAHKSQSIIKHLPIPLWLYTQIAWVEYFSED